ncbi:MAG: hypothetical protein C4343_07885, partial [Chloroflexota bacterium]
SREVEPYNIAPAPITQTPITSEIVEPHNIATNPVTSKEVEQHNITTTHVTNKQAVRQLSLGDLENIFLAAAAGNDIDYRLLIAVARVESSLNPQAKSPAGACGLMQLMPATAAKYQVSQEQLFNPEINVEIGARHLSYLIKRYGGDLKTALAAYNAGEGAVDAFRTGTALWDSARRKWINPKRYFSPIPPYAETINYVARVTYYYDLLRQHLPQPQANYSRLKKEFQPIQKTKRTDINLNQTAQNAQKPLRYYYDPHSGLRFVIVDEQEKP